MNISKTLTSNLFITAPTHDNINLGIVSINGQKVVTTDFEQVRGFNKFYLGLEGEKAIKKYLDEHDKLKGITNKSRFAVVFSEKIDQAFGITIEHENGTFLMHTLYSDQEIHEDSDVDLIAASYIVVESKNKKVDRLKSWEEISSGATIKEAFTSSKTNTGLWGQEVPIVNEDCNMCLSCILQCPDDSIDKNPITNLAELTDPTKCKSCGICVDVCNKGAVVLVNKTTVKAARDNVFSGKYGKKIEVNGESVEHELTSLKSLSSTQFKSKGYEVLFKDIVGDKSLSGKKTIQFKLSEKEEHPTLVTFIEEGNMDWKKIIRPYSHILLYGFSDHDLELATKLQLEGFYISCIPSSDDSAYNSMKSKFESAGYTSKVTLEEAINSDEVYDAVVTAYHRNVDKESYLKVSEKVGVFLAPFMKNFSRDKDLDKILKEVESSMIGFTNPHHDEDRPLGKILCQESDICSGHRACTGCPIESTFDMAMKAVREAFDTEEEKIEIVNSGATGCAEVVTTIYPDTSWKKYLHTVFGALGANLEGMNAAYRFLKKTGKIKKKFKFFGWAGDGATYDIGLQSLSGYLERGLATDSIYLCYDNGAYMNTGVQRSSATPMGAATSTTPIGEVIRGKMQFRKNLAEFAKAHEGVYVATVSISSEMDFKRKLQKAAKHDGPALIIAYSNCTTGHMTGTSLTVAQSKLAVDSGYWPLFEIENGEKKITHEPSFIRKYEATKQKIEKELILEKKSRDVLIKELEESKKGYQDEFTSSLANWLRSEGRFALHFDKKGNLKNEQSVALLLHLYEELKIDWNKLRQADRLNNQKEKLVSVLEEYIHEKDSEERRKLINNEADLFGVKIDNVEILDDYINKKSLFDMSGAEFKSPMHRIFLNIKRQLDPEVYSVLYNNELKQYKLKKPELNEKLRELGACLYTNYFEDQLNKSSIEHKALVHEEHESKIIKERIRHVESITYKYDMEEIEKQKNRAVLGRQPIPGRIFARAGDGGVTSAKMFVSLMRQIGIFGKAAPDYGPERRGAPVGTNFQLGGNELKTQASYEKLDISIVKNPTDQGWNDSEWRNTINEGGLLVVNSTLSVDQCRVIYNIPDTIKVYVLDASKLKEAHRVPETISLMGGLMRALTDIGIAFEKDYLNEKWEMLLNKEFASKANREKIVEKNVLCFWAAYNEIQTDFKQKEDNKSFRKTLNIEGFEQKTPEKLMTGSEAVAEAWRQINPGVFAMFPITPSTEVGQEFSKFWADGKVDTEYIHTESEHSSFMTIIAAAACGVRAVTSTASQGMLLGKEGGLLAATLRLPLVVNVGNRETNAPLSIHAGHTDVFQFRDDGWIQLFARNSQEAYDLAIIGQKIAEAAKLPVFINQDGFIVTHTKDMLTTLSDKKVNEFIGEYNYKDGLLFKNMTLNPISLQNYYSEHVKHADHAQKLAIPIITSVMEEYSKISGRTYHRIRTHNLDNCEVGIVCLGSTEGTVIDAIDRLAEKGIKAGMLSIKNFRPLPSKEIEMALRHVKVIIVMDRMGALGTVLSPMAMEIKAIVNREVLNLEYGRGGRNTPRELIESVFELGITLSNLKDYYVKDAVEYFIDEPDFFPLFSELENYMNSNFLHDFKNNLIEGKFIEAIGPREHIDVREKSRLRDIKLNVIRALSRMLMAEKVEMTID